jgi:hypothetical protein
LKIFFQLFQGNLWSQKEPFQKRNTGPAPPYSVSSLCLNAARSWNSELDYEGKTVVPSFLHFIIKLLDYAPGGHNVLGSIVYEQQILLEEKVFSIP